MPKISKTLTVKEIRYLPLGKHPVGGVRGLYVDKTKSGDQFFLRWQDGSRRVQKYIPKSFTLAEAREKATEWRKLIEQGINPKEKIAHDEELKKIVRQKEQKQKEIQEATFANAYKKYKQYQKKVNRWKNNPREELRQDERTNKYLMPELSDIPLKEITFRKVGDILNAIYTTKKASTATKVRTILKQLYNWANLDGYGNLDGYTPIGETLTAYTETARRNCTPSEHHPALPYEEIPDFVKEVASYKSHTAYVILFAILTATRSQASRLIEWSDIDLDNGVYRVPPEKDKVKKSKEKRVFLAKPVLEWLKILPHFVGNFIFPSSETSKPLTAEALDRFIDGLHIKKVAIDGRGWIDPEMKDSTGKPRRITLHGMRSTFRTWCADHGGAKHQPFDRDAAEFNLLHDSSSRNPMERIYNRATLDNERREIMEEWAKFCLSKTKLPNPFDT